MGNNVLYVNNKICCCFLFNLYECCFWVVSENCWVKFCVFVYVLCIIDKNGIDFVLVELCVCGEKV